MRIPLVLIVCVAMAACEQKASNTKEFVEPLGSGSEVSMAADGNPPAGRYRAVDENGEVLIEELRIDGTYTFFDEAGSELESGKYDQKSPAELCFTADAAEATEKCYAEEIGDDGVWRTIDPDTGALSIVERIDR